jgi:hypothetical protein
MNSIGLGMMMLPFFSFRAVLIRVITDHYRDDPAEVAGFCTGFVATSREVE